jgi:hypothetical protein
MLKPLISFRKSTWLPMKWWFKRKKIAALIEYPDPQMFLKKADEVFEKILEAERINDLQKLEFWRGAEHIVDGRNMYGKTEEKRDTAS